MEQLGKEFHSEQDILMSEFDSERTTMLEEHNREMTELQDIMFAMEQNFNDRENEAKSDFQSMRDEIKNKVCNFFSCVYVRYMYLSSRGICMYQIRHIYLNIGPSPPGYMTCNARFFF